MKLSPRETNFVIEQLRFAQVQYLREEARHEYCEKIDGYRKNVYEPTVRLFKDVLEKLHFEFNRGSHGFDGA